ncbi:MAG TPA: tetratricopeptide repeat protein, partial [Lacipirellulaceae bacterium]|nr:tetratricopeptide repeat protein [Lacipirellulaceae bacterium]
GGGPRRPSPQAGLQSPRASGGIPAGRQPQFAPANQPPPAYESAPAPVAPQVQVKSAVEHAQTLLVQAHQLSLTAQHEAEYSQIIQWCAAASRATLDEESQQFGAQLSAWALNRRGQHRADDGQTELAQADFRAALEFDAGNWRALHNRAVTLAQEGHFADAFDDLSRVIDLNPQFAKAWANRATLYVQAGQLDRALADYDAALAADAALVPALVGRGRLCHAQGRLEEALANLNDAVKQQPHDAQILCSRADLLSDLGRYEEALSDYATAIDVDGRLEHAFRNGAWLLATCPVDDIRDVEGALVGAQAALECGYGERRAGHAGGRLRQRGPVCRGRRHDPAGTGNRPGRAAGGLSGAAGPVRVGPPLPHHAGVGQRRRARRRRATGRLRRAVAARGAMGVRT